MNVLIMNGFLSKSDKLNSKFEQFKSVIEQVKRLIITNPECQRCFVQKWSR